MKGDPVFDQFYASQVPYVQAPGVTQFMNRDALVALLDKIGPAIVMTHSQSGAYGWPVADARPDLVKAVIAVEPSGPPVRDVETIGAPDYFKEGAGDTAVGPGRDPAGLRAGGDIADSSFNSSSRRKRMAPISCAAGCRRRRRGNCRI